MDLWLRSQPAVCGSEGGSCVQGWQQRAADVLSIELPALEKGMLLHVLRFPSSSLPETKKKKPFLSA